MCFFDSPVGRCDAVHKVVRLDTTQGACAGEHGCSPDCDCPLQGWFTERSGVGDASLPLGGRNPTPMYRQVAPPCMPADLPDEPRLEAFVFS